MKSSTYKRISMLRIMSVLFISTVGIAQQLTREEAIRLTLANNFGILIATNDIAVAKNNKNILNTEYLPRISGDAGANYQRAKTITSFPGVSNQDGTPRRDDEQLGQETQRYNAGLNLEYTLFDGLGRYYTYKKLKQQYQLSELQARETIENTILQLFSVYYEVARLSENEEVLKEILNVSQQRVTRATYQFEYGQNNKLGVLNAQVDVANDSINLLNVRQQLANTKRDLGVILNQDIARTYEVDTTLRFIPQLQLETYLTEYRAHNVTLLKNQTNRTISEYDVKVSTSGYLPTVGLNGSYGWNQSRNPPRAFFPANISNAANITAGITLSWNLFDGGATITRVKNAKIALDTQELLKKQLEADVERAINNALGTYTNRLRIYKIQQQNVLTNMNNFERSQEQFKLGQIGSVAFRQAQINLLDARTNKNLAKYNAKIAELQLIQLTGRLLAIEF